MRIRAETPTDLQAIREINEQAFGRKLEADLVDTIRASERFAPELSLVADEGDELVGHVLLSYVDLEPGTHQVLQLGPLAVRPPQQRRGVGTALMREALRLAEERAEPLVMIEGSPAYYGRFGFRPSQELGIEPPPRVEAKYFLVCTLRAYDPALRGRAVYSEAFQAVT
ncbi:MAG: putative acetyltransferase [Gaiellaceae bacterium]|nr:putative acetyltransferase [Gaiellaceae bacterium]